jgi:nitrous oxidase accessory protein
LNWTFIERERQSYLFHLWILRLCTGCVIILGFFITPGRVEAATHRVGVGGLDLATAIRSARVGDRVEIVAGVWSGPIIIDKAIDLVGAGGVIDGGGVGSVITIHASGTTLDHLRIQNSGHQLSGLTPDACVRLSKSAHHSVIKDCILEGCTFGIWVHETQDARLENNRVTGSEVGHRSNRGNGIHLFDAKRLLVKGNYITGGRDGIYVSATEDSEIIDNTLERTRYGVHYMFSYHNIVHGNKSINNGSGYAIMSSLYLKVTHNLAQGNAHHGILFRDVQYSEISDNILRDNGEGLFFYSSTENRILDNLISNNLVGVKVWAGSKRNEVRRNRFVGNRKQVYYISTEDLVWAETGEGNLWGDYLGWDTDQDGIGERPYRVDSFQTKLIYQYPAAVLLLRSPSLELLTHLERRLPLARIPTIIDKHPLMSPPDREEDK